MPAERAAGAGRIWSRWGAMQIERRLRWRSPSALPWRSPRRRTKLEGSHEPPTACGGGRPAHSRGGRPSAGRSLKGRTSLPPPAVEVAQRTPVEVVQAQDRAGRVSRPSRRLPWRSPSALAWRSPRRRIKLEGSHEPPTAGSCCYISQSTGLELACAVLRASAFSFI